MRLQQLLAAAAAAALVSFAALAADLPVTEADNGKTVTLNMDQCLVVSLQVQSGTGYDWYLMPDSTPILSLYGRTVTTPGDDNHVAVVGGPATDAFSLCAVKAGQGKVKFAYKRTWEKTAPAKTFTLNVKVLGK